MEGNTRTIDLEAIRANVRALRALTPEHAALMAVVKADAYGHGACQVARAALQAGASALAVEYPSVMALAISGMPGPTSLEISVTFSGSTSSVSVPPREWITRFSSTS